MEVMKKPEGREHGSPYDRGAADSWYYRSRNPHWIDHKNGGNRFKQDQMTPKEIAEYHASYPLTLLSELPLVAYQLT